MYVMACDMIERRVLADRTGAIVANAMAEQSVDLPDPDDARAKFDSWLNSTPEQRRYDPRRDALELALGLR